MRAFFVAAIPLTGRRRLLCLLLAFAACSDAIEIFGIKSHGGANYEAVARRQQELTNGFVAGLVGTFFAKQDRTMTLRTRIEEKLVEAFAPERLSVVDESHLHAGHQPDITGTGETHMRVRIVSAKFAGMSRLARHRAITDLLKPELDAGLHALAVEPAAPNEPTRW
jgi:BolA protein